MSTKQRIVIVTDQYDSHADAMIRHLRDLGHDPYRLHTADLAQDSHMAVRLDTAHRSEVVVDTPEGPVALHEARSIWWRRPGPFTLDHLVRAEERAYAKDEMVHGWQGALAELDCYFMSHPKALNRARYKLGQLEQARRLGLRIPDTLVTSDPSAVREFSADHPGGVIFKPLSQGFLDPSLTVDAVKHKIAYTTLLTDAVLDGMGDLGRIPTLFQGRVEKEVELRVTIIGDEVFTAEIKSQEHERTSLDWRHYEVDIPWSQGSLPDDVEAACVALTRGYGLNYGAIDLIRRPDGEHVFLEINPNGQWLFVEERVPGLRMMDAMSTCLIRGANA